MPTSLFDSFESDDDSEHDSEIPSKRSSTNGSKRRWHPPMVHDSDEEEDCSPDCYDGFLEDEKDSANDQPDKRTALHPEAEKSNQFVQPQFIYPCSRYTNHEPPLEECEEKFAVQALCREIAEQEAAKPFVGGRISADEEYTEIDLSGFSVYLPGDTPRVPYQLRPLQSLNVRQGHSELLFDGILSAGHTQRYVQGVPFDICSIGNYGEVHHEVGDNIWIQSTYNRRTNVFYRLRNPAPQYSRFHDGFLWLADLAKHFVDFCKASKKPVSIYDFRIDFAIWLRKLHGNSSAFQSWFGKYQRDDFRHALCRNIEFLYKESMGVYDTDRVAYKGFPSLPIWGQIKDVDHIHEFPIEESRTIVTQYVYDCFSHIRFAKHLKAVEPVENVRAREALQGAKLNLTARSVPREFEKTSTPKISKLVSSKTIAIDIPSPLLPKTVSKDQIQAISIGDVLSVPKDGYGSVWKDEVSQWKMADSCWYILVQGIRENAKGEKSFDGIWLYKPSDTSCAKMRYPFQNELFLSDNCTCPNKQIAEDEILGVVDVNWYGHPTAECQGLFVRQTYLENERFVSLSEEHKVCEHIARKSSPLRGKFDWKYAVGQTVLASPPRKGNHDLEIYEVVDNIVKDSKQFSCLRNLKRRKELDRQGEPNELVYTNEIVQVPVSRVHSSCLVKVFSQKYTDRKPIPAPYNRGGAGNAFYITKRLKTQDGASILEPIENNPPRNLMEGFDLENSTGRRKLRGMDLYCGGGNFGRGLEEGGAVHNKYAVDLDKFAVHTYAANLKDPSDTQIYYGSVDDVLQAAMKGNPHNISSVPLPGDVDFISAGSPCQGFSLMNSHKNSEQGLKNQSLVASVAAYVDFYRPQYGLLENVMNMAQKGAGRDEDVFSQLIACIVGMGYQTQIFVVDAWSCGSPQSRSRLFISFAAPGLEPLPHPALSHSHPDSITNRGLGRLANGQSFGSRLFERTPFSYVTCSEATRDLPVIGDGRTYLCIPYPDHVLPTSVSDLERQQIDAIPRFPRGSSFASAWKEGAEDRIMTLEERSLFPTLAKNGKVRQNVTPVSKAWSRVHPNKLFSTITGAYGIQDSKSSGSIHWDQGRPLTIHEARRAQSFPDDEILVGLKSRAWKILGNSVARSVSVALGIALREAWMKNPESPSPSPPRHSSQAISNSIPIRSGNLRHNADRPSVASTIVDDGIEVDISEFVALNSNNDDHLAQPAIGASDLHSPSTSQTTNARKSVSVTKTQASTKNTKPVVQIEVFNPRKRAAESAILPLTNSKVTKTKSGLSPGRSPDPPLIPAASKVSISERTSIACAQGASDARLNGIRHARDQQSSSSRYDDASKCDLAKPDVLESSNELANGFSTCGSATGRNLSTNLEIRIPSFSRSSNTGPCWTSPTSKHNDGRRRSLVDFPSTVTSQEIPSRTERSKGFIHLQKYYFSRDRKGRFSSPYLDGESCKETEPIKSTKEVQPAARPLDHPSSGEESEKLSFSIAFGTKLSKKKRNERTYKRAHATSLG